MVTQEFIKKVVERHAKIDNIAIKTRERPIPYLRYIAFKLCKDFGNKRTTLSSIGKTFGLDHASVLHGIKKFELYENEKWFQEFYDLYLDCYEEIQKEVKSLPAFKELMTAKQVERYYKLRHFKYAEKNREIVNSLVNKLNNFRQRPVFEEIASLEPDVLDNFEQRAKAFLIMNKSKV